MSTPLDEYGPLAPELHDAVEGAIRMHAQLPGGLLPLLHAVSEQLGWVPRQAVPLIAKALNLSRAEVLGVISFYHDFRSSPPGRHIVKVCRAEACQAMGGEALIQHIKDRLSLDFHDTSSSGEMTLEPVYCLGNCACAPSIMLDGRVHGRMNPTRFDRLLAEIES